MRYGSVVASVTCFMTHPSPRSRVLWPSCCLVTCSVTKLLLGHVFCGSVVACSRVRWPSCSMNQTITCSVALLSPRSRVLWPNSSPGSRVPSSFRKNWAHSLGIARSRECRSALWIYGVWKKTLPSVEYCGCHKPHLVIVNLSFLSVGDFSWVTSCVHATTMTFDFMKIGSHALTIRRETRIFTFDKEGTNCEFRAVESSYDWNELCRFVALFRWIRNVQFSPHPPALHNVSNYPLQSVEALFFFRLFSSPAHWRSIEWRLSFAVPQFANFIPERGNWKNAKSGTHCVAFLW